MANSKAADKHGRTSEATPGSALSSAVNREYDELPAVRREPNHSGDDVYEDRDGVLGARQLASEPEYLELLDDDNKPGDLDGGSKKKKRGVKEFCKKLFLKMRKGNKRTPPSLAYVAACNKEVAIASKSGADLDDTMQDVAACNKEVVIDSRSGAYLDNTMKGDFPVDYYNNCNAATEPEDGGTTTNEDRSLTPDSTSGKSVRIGSPTDSIISPYLIRVDSPEYYNGKFPSNSSLHEYYETLPDCSSHISENPKSEDTDLYDDIPHLVQNRQTYRSQTISSTSQTNCESPMLKRSLPLPPTKPEPATAGIPVEMEVPGPRVIEDEKPERLGRLEDIRSIGFIAEVASSSAIASSCALESVVIPSQSLELASVKDKCIESFEKISSYHRLLENIKDVHPVHGVLGPFVDYKSPSVAGAYKACVETLDEVAEWICENHEEFAGDLIGTGSFHDGTKVGRANEFDFLFQLRNTSFQVHLENRKNLTFKVMSDCADNGSFSEMCEKVRGKCYLMSDKFYRTFAGYVNEALATIKLPSKMRHAGFCSPRFSGVRRCGPAITIPIYFQHRTNKEVLITIDISPALPVWLSDIQRVANIQWPFSVLDQIDESETAQLHLIPSDRRFLWKLSTATLEVSYMAKNFAGDGKVRRTIQIVKSLLEKHLTVRIEGTESEKAQRKQGMVRFAEKYLKEGTLVQHVQHLASQKKLREMLLLHQACLGICKSSMVPGIERMEAILREEMLEGWGTVDPITLNLANEMTPPCVSTKSCVVKYAALDLFLNDSLSDDDHSSPSLRLIHAVLQSSTQEEVTHSLLRTDIKTKNVSAYAERSVPNMSNADWIDLHNDLGAKLLDKIQDLKDKRSIAGDKYRDIPVPVTTNDQPGHGGPHYGTQCSQLTADNVDHAIPVTHNRRSGTWMLCGDSEPHVTYQPNLAAHTPLTRDNSAPVLGYRVRLPSQSRDPCESFHCDSYYDLPERTCTARQHSTFSPHRHYNEVHAVAATVCGCMRQQTNHCSPFLAQGQTCHGVTLHNGINRHNGCVCSNRSLSALDLCPAASTDCLCDRNPDEIVVPDVRYPDGIPAPEFHQNPPQIVAPGYPQYRFKRVGTVPTSRTKHFLRRETKTRSLQLHNICTAFPQSRSANACVGNAGTFYLPDR